MNDAISIFSAQSNVGGDPSARFLLPLCVATKAVQCAHGSKESCGRGKALHAVFLLTRE